MVEESHSEPDIQVRSEHEGGEANRETVDRYWGFPTSAAEASQAKPDEDEEEGVSSEEDISEEEADDVKLGISLKHLKDLADRATSLGTGDSTVQEICESVIWPACAGMGGPQGSRSYASVAAQKGWQDSRGKPASCKATHYVCYARGYKYTHFVDALSAWVANASGCDDQGSFYFCIDVFVMSQYRLRHCYSKSWLGSMLCLIQGIGHTILILEPWDLPLPYQQALNVWELHCTAQTGARLSFAVCDAVMENFRGAWRGDFNVLCSSSRKIDVRNAQAFKVKNRDAILREVSRERGLTSMNECLQLRLRQWYLEQGRKFLDELRLAGTDPKEWCHVQDNLARLYREHNSLPEAERLFNELREVCTDQLGAESQQTLQVLNQYAVTLQKMGRTDEAREMHEKILQIRMKHYGECHADTLQTLSNLAVLYSQSVDPVDQAKARELYKTAVRGRRALAPNHPSTLYTISNFARLLSMSPDASLPDLDDAEKLHNEAVEGLAPDLGESAPLTLMARHNRWEHSVVKAREILKSAKRHLDAVASQRTEKLGHSHPDTEASRCLAHQLLSHQWIFESSDRGRSLFDGSESWKVLSMRMSPVLNTRVHIQKARAALREYGVHRLREQLGDFVNEDGLLTVGTAPFNVFARYAAGLMAATPELQAAQECLGPYEELFMIVFNRKENAENWRSDDPTWRGKASMSKHHVLMTVRDLHWKWFNVIVFGMFDNLRASIELLQDMRAAALRFVANDRSKDWSKNIGLYFHLYGHSSVNSLHLHIVDLDFTGPSFQALQYKNALITDVIAVLKFEEMEQNLLRMDQDEIHDEKSRLSRLERLAMARRGSTHLREHLKVPVVRSRRKGDDEGGPPNPVLSGAMRNLEADFQLIRHIATSIRKPDYNLKQYFEDCRAAFPELELFFTAGEGRGSHTGVVGGLTAEVEYQRTMGALFAVYWLLRLDTDGPLGFCFGHDGTLPDWPVKRRTQTTPPPGDDRPFAKQTEDQKRDSFYKIMCWDQFAALVQNAGCGEDGDIDRTIALLCLTSFHDIMKVEALQPVVAEEHGPYLGVAASKTLFDHDMALSYVLSHYPSMLPSFRGLTSKAKQAVLFTQGKINFNHGWFVQGEAPPGAMLSTFKRVLEEGCASPSDVAFSFLHWITDLAGAEATPLGGAEKFVLKFPHAVLASFLWSMPFLGKLAEVTETEVFEEYLKARWTTAFPDAVVPEDHTAIAQLRLVVMAQGGWEVVPCFRRLSRVDQELLSDEMARTGCSGQTYRSSRVEGGPAILVYYGPALLQQFARDDEKTFLALNVLCEVYRAARVIFPLHEGRQGQTVQCEIGQLKAADLEAVVSCPASGSRQVWVLVKKDDSQAAVELKVASQVNALNAAGVRYYVLDFNFEDDVPVTKSS